MKLKENALNIILREIDELKQCLNMWEKDDYTMSTRPHIVTNIKRQIALLENLIDYE